ncbi:hypothetical protein JTB14_027778 [Gonioctena quinquepunctata]|nr:hypothetical protein JTB14_027778 [Gonioctena quinquepunctata]
MTFVQGKVALVTGGSSGIGLALTKQLLENGVKGVGIVDISQKNLEVSSSLQCQYGDRVLFVRADATKEDELKDAFQKTIDKFNHLDIVFNNAGIANEIQWEKTVAVNLSAVMRGTFLALNEFLPKYKSTDEGLIVNTASILGINTIPHAPAYCATKHGVVGLGKALGSNETYEKNGIKLITICPGVVETSLIDNFAAEDKSILMKELAELCRIVSSPKYVAESILEIINKGRHGSIWVMEDEKTPYEVEFPHRLELCKKM